MPLFSPVTWVDGDDPLNTPSADDLNSEWRDSFDFFLNNKPMILLHHTTGSVTVPLSTAVVAIPFDTEVVKRGGMVHSTSTNTSRVTVPYTGQYTGYAQLGIGTVSTLVSGFVIQIRKNGTTVLIQPGKMTPVALSDTEFNVSFTVDLAANDYIEFLASALGSTASTNTGGTNRCKLGLWYAGDYQ